MGRLFADTSQVVEDELIKRLGQLPPWRKLEMVASLNSAVREMFPAGLRQRYPVDTAEQLNRRLASSLNDPGTIAQIHQRLGGIEKAFMEGG